MLPRQDLEGCERYFLAIKQINGNASRYKGFPVRCHRWDCPLCARIKADKYKARIKPFFQSAQLYFYTFTYYHSAPPEIVWGNYGKAWNRFRTAATKKFGRFAYVRVLEHHKRSPYPHLHLIADRYFPSDWFAKEIIAAGFGYQANAQAVTSEEAATYITKYLTKPWTSETCKDIRRRLHLRIISFGGFNPAHPPTDGPWEAISRAVMCDDLLASIRRDVDWTLGVYAALTYSKVTEDFVEYTFVIAEDPPPHAPLSSP